MKLELKNVFQGMDRIKSGYALHLTFGKLELAAGFALKLLPLWYVINWREHSRQYRLGPLMIGWNRKHEAA